MRKPFCIENSYTLTTVASNKLYDLFDGNQKDFDELYFYEFVVKPEETKDNARYVYSFQLNCPKDTKDVKDRLEALKQQMFPAFTFDVKSRKWLNAFNDLTQGKELMITYETLVLMKELNISLHDGTP